jgi:Uma2 family endonuclease
MATVLTSAPIDTLADLLDRLGGVSPSRVRFRPAPGTATEADVLEIERRENRLFELVDGVLVEKAMGYIESLLAIEIARLIKNFVLPGNLGLVSGSDGMMRLFSGLVRIPDVAFASWDRFPDRKVPNVPIPDLVPDLAVEVLSESNTDAEMTLKVSEYFSAGVRLVWLVDPETRTVAVYSAPNVVVLLHEHDTLDGGTVLPGFSLPLGDLFAELDRHANP